MLVPLQRNAHLEILGHWIYGYLWSMDYLVTTYSKVSVPIKLLPGHFGQCVCVISLGYSRRSQTSHNTWRCGVDRSRHRNALNKDPSASAATEPGWISNKVIATVPIWSKCKHTWASMLTMLFMRYLCLLISPCMMPAVSEGKELRLLPAPPTRLGGWILQGLRWGNRWRSGGGELPHSLWLPLGFRHWICLLGRRVKPQHGCGTKEENHPIYACGRLHGGQNYLLLAMDMAKVGGPLSVVKVCTSMLCAKIGYRISVSGWSCEGFHTNLNIPSPLPTSPYYFSLPLVLLVKRLLMCRHLWSVSVSILASQVTQYRDRRHKRSKWTSGCRCRPGNLGTTFRQDSMIR